MGNVEDVMERIDESRIPDPTSDNANIEFVVNYKFDGHNWGTSVWASTWEEAEMKVKAMGKGKVTGRLVRRIPAGDEPADGV